MAVVPRHTAPEELRSRCGVFGGIGERVVFLAKVPGGFPHRVEFAVKQIDPSVSAARRQASSARVRPRSVHPQRSSTPDRVQALADFGAAPGSAGHRGRGCRSGMPRAGRVISGRNATLQAHRVAAEFAIADRRPGHRRPIAFTEAWQRRRDVAK